MPANAHDAGTAAARRTSARRNAGRRTVASLVTTAGGRRRTADARTRRTLARYVSALAVATLLTACGGTSGGRPSHHHAASSATAGPTAPMAAVGNGSYVALGDSYTSGPEIPRQIGRPAGCERSDRDYPTLVARYVRVSLAKFHNMSCSGATTADLADPQRTTEGTNPAQLSALSASTTLVTLGIGGNDIDFVGVLTRCASLDLIGKAVKTTAGGSHLAPCRVYYTRDGVDQLRAKIQRASELVAEALDEIRERAPRARVYVVGYPELLPAGGRTCAETLGISQGDLAFLHNDELALNAMLRQRAKAAGAVYVDTYAPSRGHDACVSATSRWLEPWLPSSPAAPLHPNARGERGMAEAVIHAITT